MKITAVVPIYNIPDDILGQVLEKLGHYVEEIVVIDDGSTINVKRPNLNNQCRVLRHVINRGQGAALQTGTAYALDHGADIIVHFDGDGQHCPEDISELIKPLKENQADIVFGSRFLGKKSAIPFSKKYLILPMAKIINRLFTGLKLSDAHNGLRAFRAEVAAKLILTQDRMAHSSEYPYLVKKNHLRYAESPMTVIYHHYGQGLVGGIKIIKELIINKII
jgi:glycosyltransferase involved in cell wall biosynthesis